MRTVLLSLPRLLPLLLCHGTTPVVLVPSEKAKAGLLSSGHHTLGSPASATCPSPISAEPVLLPPFLPLATAFTKGEPKLRADTKPLQEWSLGPWWESSWPPEAQASQREPTLGWGGILHGILAACFPGNTAMDSQDSAVTARPCRGDAERVFPPQPRAPLTCGPWRSPGCAKPVHLALRSPLCALHDWRRCPGPYPPAYGHLLLETSGSLPERQQARLTRHLMPRGSAGLGSPAAQGAPRAHPREQRGPTGRSQVLLAAEGCDASAQGHSGLRAPQAPAILPPLAPAS